MDKPSFSDAQFKKSSTSADKGCVQVAKSGEHIAVRHSKHPEEGTLVFNRREWQAFLEGIRLGEFDLDES